MISGSRNTTEQSPNINNHQLKQKRDDSFGGNMLEDGQVDRGEPIEGFFDQFTEMIERVFPTRNR